MPLPSWMSGSQAAGRGGGGSEYWKAWCLCWQPCMFGQAAAAPLICGLRYSDNSLGCGSSVGCVVLPDVHTAISPAAAGILRRNTQTRCALTARSGFPQLPSTHTALCDADTPPCVHPLRHAVNRSSGNWGGVIESQPTTHGLRRRDSSSSSLTKTTPNRALGDSSGHTAAKDGANSGSSAADKADSATATGTSGPRKPGAPSRIPSASTNRAPATPAVAAVASAGGATPAAGGGAGGVVGAAPAAASGKPAALQEPALEDEVRWMCCSSGRGQFGATARA